MQCVDKELWGNRKEDPAAIEATLQRYSKAGQYFGFNIGDLCERVLDSKLYANIMMLGIAFQKGYLPLKLDAIESAIRSVVHHETERNLRAFNIGRKIADKPELFIVGPTHEVESARKAFRRKINTVRMWYGGKRCRKLAKQLRVLLKQTQRATKYR